MYMYYHWLRQSRMVWDMDAIHSIYNAEGVILPVAKLTSAFYLVTGQDFMLQKLPRLLVIYTPCRLSTGETARLLFL